jgi:hypothetical protein
MQLVFASLQNEHRQFIGYLETVLKPLNGHKTPSFGGILKNMVRIPSIGCTRQILSCASPKFFNDAAASPKNG